MKFNKSLDWLKESDEDEIFGDELDDVKGDEEQINEVRYINPDNLDRYNPDEIEEVTTASGEKRYKRKSGVASNQTVDKKEEPKEKELPKEEKSVNIDIRNDKVLKRKDFFNRMRHTKNGVSAFARRYDVDRELAHLIEEYPPEQIEELFKNSSYRGENDYLIFKHAKEGAEHFGDDNFLKEKVDSVIKNIDANDVPSGPGRFGRYIWDGIDALSSALPQDPQQFIQSLKPYIKDLGKERLAALIDYKSKRFKKELEKQLDLPGDSYWPDEEEIVNKIITNS